MRSKKKYKNSYTSTGIGMIASSVAVGSIPNISGTAGEANIKSKFSEGMGKMGTALPVYGKVKGTTMVLKPLKELTNAHKKIKIKGGYEI